MEKIVCEDCLEGMKRLPSNSIDLVATDPPYGLSFMGKNWDKALPDVEVWEQCLRILKPGAFAFVMSIPRQDCLSRMIINLEDAGFKVNFTSIYWTYASGFLKAGNIGKLVDKKLGKKRKIIGKAKHPTSIDRTGNKSPFQYESHLSANYNITAPMSLEAKSLDGSYAGFQPKPAVEVIIVAMKPLSEKTYVDQALKRYNEEKKALNDIAELIKDKYNEEAIWV